MGILNGEIMVQVKSNTSPCHLVFVYLVLSTFRGSPRAA